ncbi:MAG TPA: preprotein translocase subunit YajC [Ignavibacteria bacterium]|nr:preprotein translocase subunit YajC [Ignavibacteria bacterium]
MENLSIILQQPGGEGPLGMLMSFLPFLLIILVFYFLILRPQQKRQKERQNLLSSLKKGDKVITAGGIHGTVEAITDTMVTVRIADNVNVNLERSSIATIKGIMEHEQPKR